MIIIMTPTEGVTSLCRRPCSLLYLLEKICSICFCRWAVVLLLDISQVPTVGLPKLSLADPLTYIDGTGFLIFGLRYSMSFTRITISSGSHAMLVSFGATDVSKESFDFTIWSRNRCGKSPYIRRFLRTVWKTGITYVETC